MEDTTSGKSIDELQASIITQINNLVVNREAGKRPSDSTKRQPLLQPMKEVHQGKKTLVLDLDETLVHSSFQPLMKTDIVFPIMLEGRNQYIYVSKRPGMDEFLKRMTKYYELVIFTASVSKYADPLITLLDKSNLIEHRLYREHCVLKDYAFVKDLSNLGRPLSEVIIVDNCPSCYALHSANGLPIETWINNPSDKKLIELIPVLELLARQPDVRVLIKKIVIKNKINFVEVNRLLESEKGIVSNISWSKAISSPIFTWVPKPPEESQNNQKSLFLTHLQATPKLRTQIKSDNAVNPSPSRTLKAVKLAKMFSTPNKKSHKNALVSSNPIINPIRQQVKLTLNPRSPTKTAFAQIHFSKEETKLSTFQAARRREDGRTQKSTRVSNSSQKKMNPNKRKSKLSFSQYPSHDLISTHTQTRLPVEGTAIIAQHLTEPFPKPSTSCPKPKRRIEVSYSQSNTNQILIHQPGIKNNIFPSPPLSVTHAKSRLFSIGSLQTHFYQQSSFVKISLKKDLHSHSFFTNFSKGFNLKQLVE